MPQNRNLKLKSSIHLSLPIQLNTERQDCILEATSPKTPVTRAVFIFCWLAAVLATSVYSPEHSLSLSWSLIPTKPDSGNYVPLLVCNPTKKACVLRHRKGYLCHLIKSSGLSHSYQDHIHQYTLTGTISLSKTAELQHPQGCSASPRVQNSDDKNENK